MRLLSIACGLMVLSLLSSVGCADPAAQTAKRDGPSTVPATSAVAATGSPRAPAATQPSTRPAFAYVGDDHLHNAHRVTDKIVSGAAPEDEQAFQRLQELGIKTILSVDGARPDVEMARRFGMRYVHLPITYSTVTAEQGKEIAKALAEQPGPIYVHCHHGKHRAAAAVAVACVYNGMLRPEQAESVLQTFGTGENYTGLWKAAREAKPVNPAELKAMQVKFVEVTKIPPLADAMVELDRTFDHLKLIQRSGWHTPGTDPDLDPAHEALQLQEKLRELARTPEIAGKPEAFRKMLAESEQAAAGLHASLADWQKANSTGTPPTAIESAYTRTNQSCVSCHKAYRD